MFELSVAFKYLLPRWRQLSVSIISLVSILVIALVVWLVILFFSVTQGLEKSWVHRLTSLTAPIRITPTENYYRSYYYQIDSVSSASDYSFKSIHEKLQSPPTDPYRPLEDGELPTDWPTPDLAANGQLKDLVQEVSHIAATLPEVSLSDFEITSASLRFNIHAVPNDSSSPSSSLAQTTYLASMDSDQPLAEHLKIPLTEQEKTRVSFWQKQPSAYDAILLPKTFKDAGIQAGDLGQLFYAAATLSGVQEQRLPIYVAGFYDPGIMPLGGKFALVDRQVVELIRNAGPADEVTLHNGFNVRFEDLNQAENLKKRLLDAFERSGIAPYWHVETYREFEFTKDFIQQLSSERNLWTLLATVIILVACSNIISMLILLVNDKKQEIAILRAMGASSLSIAAIFGLCGVMIGLIGSTLGTVFGIITLKNLQSLLNWIGSLQGHEMFNPIFYGNTLPNELSFHALVFVVTVTSFISLLAGFIPAMKACMVNPAITLRSG